MVRGRLPSPAMELVQVHRMEPFDADGVRRALRGLVRGTDLHRRASLQVTVDGPWRPADRWPGSLERLVWTASFTSPSGAFFTDGAAEGRVLQALVRREAPLHPAELVLRAMGDGLVLHWSDAGRLAYVAVYRERQLRWSLLLEDRVRLVRCDGEVVTVDRPPRWVAEGDRVGVLLAGWASWLREPLGLPEDGRFTFPDEIGALAVDGETVELVRDGEWELGAARSAG